MYLIKRFLSWSINQQDMTLNRGTPQMQCALKNKFDDVSMFSIFDNIISECTITWYKISIIVTIHIHTYIYIYIYIYNEVSMYFFVCHLFLTALETSNLFFDSQLYVCFRSTVNHTILYIFLEKIDILRSIMKSV